MLKIGVRLTELGYVIFDQSKALASVKTGLQKRWAGHAKWQNIKHTKETKERQKSLLHSKIRRDITNACKRGGSNNPEANLELKQVIEQAKKCHIPAATIENMIIGSAKGDNVEVLAVRGPAGSVFIIEVIAKRNELARVLIKPILKKIGFKVDDDSFRLFDQKGIVISNIKKDYDQAVEDAIEAGFEEVIEIPEENKLRFECRPNSVAICKQRLENLGYQVESAEALFLPQAAVGLTDSDLELCSDFLSRLEKVNEVVKIHDNIG